MLSVISPQISRPILWTADCDHLHASQPIALDLYVAYCLGPKCNLPSWCQASYQVCLGACQWAELIAKHILGFLTAAKRSAMPTSIHTTGPHAHDYHLLICSLDVCFLEMLEMYVDVGS